jgi:hypothetical protein
VESVPFSKASYAVWRSSCHETRCSSPIAREG